MIWAFDRNFFIHTGGVNIPLLTINRSIQHAVIEEETFFEL